MSHAYVEPDPKLLAKYDVPVPRYTSYPTVPYWSDSPSTEDWTRSLTAAFARPEASWSIYVHIPFCESLCTFCGCNTVITRAHDRERPYAATLERELELYLAAVPAMRDKPLRQVHLGGGTPTFLSAPVLDDMLKGMLGRVNVDSAHFDGSFEVDPRRTSVDQLEVLLKHDFRRVSMGVQDFDPEVQRLVNRVQPFEQTRELTEGARRLGYDSVNFDLIYGLPKQRLANFERTIAQTIELRPERIALYSFALVPWIKPAQRLFKDEDLPVGADKRALYEMAYRNLSAAGYVEIGMDHFALPHDALARALETGDLHRNFMGYTERRTDVLLGLGVSAIGEAPDCFHQNEKVLPVYEKALAEGRLPTLRGHKLTASDRAHRERVLRFMTRGAVELVDAAAVADARHFLADMIADGLVTLNDRTLAITTKGRPFLRNACVVFDERLRERQPSTRIFSKAL